MTVSLPQSPSQSPTYRSVLPRLLRLYLCHHITININWLPPHNHITLPLLNSFVLYHSMFQNYNKCKAFVYNSLFSYMKLRNLGYSWQFCWKAVSLFCDSSWENAMKSAELTNQPGGRVAIWQPSDVTTRKTHLSRTSPFFTYRPHLMT